MSTAQARRGAARRALWVGALGALSCCLISALAFLGQPATATSPGLNGRLVVAAGFDPDIWLGRPDGTEAVQLTSGSDDDSCPAVSPSGQLVAFCRSNGIGNDLWVMNADGSDIHQLTDFRDITASLGPTFSSSVPRVAFSFVRNFREVRTLGAVRDFRQVAALPGLTYDLRSIRTDGTQPKLLTRSANWHDFNPSSHPADTGCSGSDRGPRSRIRARLSC